MVIVVVKQLVVRKPIENSTVIYFVVCIINIGVYSLQIEEFYYVSTSGTGGCGCGH